MGLRSPATHEGEFYLPGPDARARQATADMTRPFQVVAPRRRLQKRTLYRC